MRTVDFVLYLPSDSYSLQASGSLMDALASKTPVIGLSTDFSAELAGKIGTFGFFFNSLENVVEFIGQADVHLLAASKSVFVEKLTEGVALTEQIGLRDLVTVLRDCYPSST